MRKKLYQLGKFDIIIMIKIKIGRKIISVRQL